MSNNKDLTPQDFFPEENEVSTNSVPTKEKNYIDAPDDLPTPGEDY